MRAVGVRTQPPEIDPSLRHVIRAAGGRFDLVTHYGYVLKSFATIEEARAYHGWHCNPIQGDGADQGY